MELQRHGKRIVEMLKCEDDLLTYVTCDNYAIPNIVYNRKVTYFSEFIFIRCKSVLLIKVPICKIAK